MTEEKFAVYVVIIEDTEDAFQRMADAVPVWTNVGVPTTYREAEDMLYDIERKYQPR